MAPPWVQALTFIQNGEPVTAAIPNRPLAQLQQRTDYLKAILDILSAGGSITDTDAPVASTVEEGQAVYWNSTTLQFDQALAALAYDGNGTYSGNADSAYVLGVCASKTSTTRGVILFAGSTDGIDFTSGMGTGETFGAGPYFLSSTEPGKMTVSRPSVGVYVMFGLTSGVAVVAPSMREVLENHTHYNFSLLYGNVLSATAGWSSVIDTSIAPAGALYRYTIEADSQLYAMFPFSPATGVFLEIDGIGGNSKVTIDNNGIWWTNVDFDPSDYTTMILYYAKPTTGSITSLVRTMQAGSDSPLLTVTDCNGEAATRGDLYLHLNLLAGVGDDDTTGWTVMKQLNSSGQVLSGPVVESVKSASPEITISYGSEEGAALEGGGKVGNLIVSYNSPATASREIASSLVELNGALQEDYDGIPYVGLPSRSFDTSASYQFDVASSGITGDFSGKFYAWIYSSTAGALSSTGIEVDYTVIKAAVDTVAYALTDVTKVLTGTGYLTMLPNFTMNANGYRKASFTLTGVTIEPGDQVSIKLTRSDSGAYGGTIGVLRSWLAIEQS